jgi:hypothetical protein
LFGQLELGLQLASPTSTTVRSEHRTWQFWQRIQCSLAVEGDD